MRKKKPQISGSPRWKQLLWDKRPVGKQQLHTHWHIDQRTHNRGTDLTAVNNRALWLGLHAHHLHNVLPKEPQAAPSRSEVDASLAHSAVPVSVIMKCHSQFPQYFIFFSSIFSFLFFLFLNLIYFPPYIYFFHFFPFFFFSETWFFFTSILFVFVFLSVISY